MGGPVFLYPQLLSAAAMFTRAAALCPKSLLPRYGLAHINIAVRRTAFLHAAVGEQQRRHNEQTSAAGIRSEEKRRPEKGRRKRMRYSYVSIRTGPTRPDGGSGDEAP